MVLGVGSIGSTAPLLIDGFVTPEELAELLEAGAVGELRSHPFDRHGVAIVNSVTARLTAVPLPAKPKRPTVLVAAGRPKAEALQAALLGHYANGLVIDEPTASRLLERRV